MPVGRAKSPRRALAVAARSAVCSDMANKRDRQATIRELIEGRAVESQEELRKLLLHRGWDVTQSTLSRDLRELRIARVPLPDGGARYAVAATAEDESPRLDALLPLFFTHIGGVGELIVLPTRRSSDLPLSESPYGKVY